MEFKDRLPASLLRIARKRHDVLKRYRHVARCSQHVVQDSKLRLLVALRLQQNAFGRSPDLVHPQLYTDKIRWRMLYDRRPLMQVCSDRLAARDYVAARVGQQYLVPLLGVFDRPGQIPWAELSPPYVVKPTHGCEWSIIVRSPSDVDSEHFEELLGEWLKTNYYHRAWEWSYKHVPRRIIVERFIGLDGSCPEDYKFHCFDGEPRFIAIYHGRFTPEWGWIWRDLAWNPVDFISPGDPPDRRIPPPSRLTEMTEVARLLSSDFDYIRVDLYCVGDRVYFGELTPTPGAGDRKYTPEGESWMGAFWRLPSRAALRNARRRSPNVAPSSPADFH